MKRLISSIPSPSGVFAGLALLWLLQAFPVVGQDTHLNGGAVSPNQGGALKFLNGGNFSESSGYVKTLSPALDGPYAGYYQGGITLTVVHSLSGTDAAGIPYVADPQGAALGSFIQYGIVSVTGPAGGSFQFWEDDATAPTYTYGVGYNSPLPSNLVALSDASLGAGQPGGDPYGHLHGRRFTTTTEGEYTVGFQLVDTSVNGAGGGPIQTPSDVLYVKFSAVPEPQTVALAVLGLGSLGVFLRRRR